MDDSKNISDIVEKFENILTLLDQNVRLLNFVDKYFLWLLVPIVFGFAYAITIAIIRVYREGKYNRDIRDVRDIMIKIDTTMNNFNDFVINRKP